MYENYERIKMIKHVHENDEDIHLFDMDWLIRQAERADEYDRNLISLEDNRHYVSGLEQQNKRYREALEFIVNIDGHFMDKPFNIEKALNLIDREARGALEGEE